jgi:D-alanyl-D-alanine carboxypeptidase/D-alanyl-D-alanine-endopeptidase (penicillin-binding protein 4)
MLPARLALWQVPRVARSGLQAPGPVLAPASARGQVPSRGRLTALLAPLLATHALGRHAGAVVTDVATGTVLFSQNAGSEFVPASNAKLLTAVAALSTLGPSARFTTRVVAGARPGATLASLAAATAHWLAGRNTRTVRLTYDTSLFTGPSTAPGWTPSYVSTGNVTPITSLEVDQGRLTPSGAPQDADDPGNFRARSGTPATEAAGAFARLLRRDGIHVAGQAVAGRQPPHATQVAAVRSPPLASIVGWMLRESNNVIAEDLARQIAVHARKPASFSGGAAAVTAILGRLGVHHGIHLVDGSGLSPADQVTPGALAAVVRLAAVSGPGALRAAVTGMPVAGFSGTLAPGQSVFGSFGRQALGMVRAKTGNLSKVASLAGIAADASGQVLAFAFMADQIPKGSQLPAAAAAIDAMTTVLAGCGCR